VLVVVPHERARIQGWAKKAGGKYPVLADGGFLASALFGVAYQMHIHTDTSNTPGAFVIGKDGLLKWAKIGKGPKSYSDRPTEAQLIAKVKETGAAR